MFENNKKSSLTNWIFFAIVLVSFVIAIFIHQSGKKQDSVFLEEYQQYSYAIELLNENKSHEAQMILEQLVMSHTNSPYLLWYYGLSLAMVEDYDKSIEMLQNALEKRPFLIKDPNFTHNLGEVYFFHSEYEKAKVYLEYCLNLDITDEQKQRIQILLNLIDSKL